MACKTRGLGVGLPTSQTDLNQFIPAGASPGVTSEPTVNSRATDCQVRLDPFSDATYYLGAFRPGDSTGEVDRSILHTHQRDARVRPGRTAAGSLTAPDPHFGIADEDHLTDFRLWVHFLPVRQGMDVYAESL